MLLPFLLLLAVSAGVPWISPAFWQSTGYEQMILLHLRLPRVLLAFLAGGGLAVAGMVYQALFRNPLATPYTLGLASGASLGAAMVTLFGLGVGLAGGLSVAGAMGGALATMGLVLLVGRAAGGLTQHSLLLAGVALNFICGSLVMLAQYLADYTQTFRLLRWLMGSITAPGTVQLIFTALLVLGGSVVLLLHHRELDLLCTGEELAASRGRESAPCETRCAGNQCADCGRGGGRLRSHRLCGHDGAAYSASSAGADARAPWCLGVSCRWPVSGGL